MGKKEGKGMHVGDQDDATSLLTAPEPSSSANTRDKHSASAGEGGGRRLWVDIPYGDVHAAGYTDMEGGSIRDGDGGLSSSFSSQHTTTRGGRGDHPHHHHSSRQRGGRGGNVSGGEDGGDLSSISAVRQASSVGERKGSGSAVEMRKAVSVLSVASSLATEGLFHTNDRHRKRATGEVGESLGGGGVEDHPQTGQAEGGAFLDAEEQGEIHRVLVAEEDVRALVDSYAESDDRRDVKGVIESTLNEAFGDEGKDGGKGRKGRNANQMQLARRIGAGAGRLLPRRRRWSDWGREVSVLIQINFLNLFRNPMSTLVQLGLNIFLGVMFGIIFFNVQKRDETFETARNTFGCLFFLAAQFVFGPLDCLVLFSEDRELFNRDTANGNYSPSAYFVAKSLANLPFQHIPITCYAIISFFMCGLYLDVAKFFIFLAIGQLTIFASTSFLFCVSAGSPRIAVAQAIAPMVLLVFLLVGGFYSRSEDIPAVIRWVKYISPIYYSYASLALNQFDPSGTWGDTSNKTLLTTYGGLTETEMGFSIGMLTLLGCVLRFLSFLFLKYTNRRIGLEA
ncbi:atp-binding cassette g family transporter abcg107 [Cystoisospora suis]|uniref:Atp-binding cassette g family transporter abcg107 n=1 Tax=Cystoisospora suis TaxID=483139 RepID=A0A2C6L9V3_9APIC|nr:atp-binding cassette g family transporter abcg107 [Cystoisospora suis]